MRGSERLWEHERTRSKFLWAHIFRTSQIDHSNGSIDWGKNQAECLNDTSTCKAELVCTFHAVQVYSCMPLWYRRADAVSQQKIQIRSHMCKCVYVLHTHKRNATSGFRVQNNVLQKKAILSCFCFASVRAFGSLSSHALTCNNIFNGQRWRKLSWALNAKLHVTFDWKYLLRSVRSSSLL